MGGADDGRSKAVTAPSRCQYALATTHLQDAVATRLEQIRAACGFPQSLREAGVPANDLPMLARDAATQWRGGVNRRPLDEAGALELYRSAF